jgi:hypothetical protein
MLGKLVCWVSGPVDITDLLWNPGQVDVWRSILSRPEASGEHAHAQVHSVQVFPCNKEPLVFLVQTNGKKWSVFV